MTIRNLCHMIANNASKNRIIEHFFSPPQNPSTTNSQASSLNLNSTAEHFGENGFCRFFRAFNVGNKYTWLGPCSPLMVAALQDNQEICELLLEKGADINFLGARHKDYTALDCAVKWGGNPNLVRYLKSQGALSATFVCGRELCESIVKASDQDIKRIIDEMVEKSVSLNVKIENVYSNAVSGYVGPISPLALAILLGKVEIISYLIEKGADIDYKVGRDNDLYPLTLAKKWAPKKQKTL